MTDSKRNFSLFSLVVILIGIVAGMAFGFNNGVFAGVLLFLKSSLHVSSAQKELINGSNLVGAVVGSLGLASIADKFGRRGGIWVAAIFTVIGSIGSSQATTLDTLMVFRFCGGVALGMYAIVAPIYVAEIIPARFRGFAIGIFQLGIVGGIALGGWVDYFFSPTGSWRTMLAIGVVPAIVLSVFLFFVPDTARWYAMKGEIERSRKVLFRTYRDGNVVEEQSLLIQDSLNPTRIVPSADGENGNSLSGMRRQAFKLAMLFGLAINFFDALVGIQALNYYTPTIFSAAGFGKHEALLWTSIIGSATMVATVLGLL